MCDTPKTGVVSQLSDGTVFKCTMAEECMKLKANGEGNMIPPKKQCMLSVDHGDRCQAWDIEQSEWLIHKDTDLVEEL